MVNWRQLALWLSVTVEEHLSLFRCRRFLTYFFCEAGRRSAQSIGALAFPLPLAVGAPGATTPCSLSGMGQSIVSILERKHNLCNSLKYEDWTIDPELSNESLLAVLTEPESRKPSKPRICLPGAESAEHYARRFVNWYITLEQRRLKVRRSTSATTRLLNTRLSLSRQVQSSGATESTQANAGVNHELTAR